RVVELAPGGVEVGRVAPDRSRAPPEPAARSLHPERSAELGVVRGPRHLETAARERRAAVRVGQLGGNDVHHAAEGVGAIEDARPRDTLCARRRRSPLSPDTGSDEPSAAIGCRVAVTVTGSTWTAAATSVSSAGPVPASTSPTRAA